MGGKLNVIVKLENSNIFSFKLFTAEYENLLNTPHILNENYLTKALQDKNIIIVKNTEISQEEHNDYESQNSLLAPYYYGLILIDYKNQHILSYNDYSDFFSFNSYELQHFIKKSNLTKYDNETLVQKLTNGASNGDINYLENKISIFNNIHMLFNAIKYELPIYYKDKILTGNLAQVIEEISNITYPKKSPLFYLGEGDDEHSLIEEGIGDLRIIPNDWKITSLFSENVKEVLSYMQNNNIKLSNADMIAWEQYFKELSDKNKLSTS